MNLAQQGGVAKRYVKIKKKKRQAAEVDVEFVDVIDVTGEGVEGGDGDQVDSSRVDSDELRKEKNKQGTQKRRSWWYPMYPLKRRACQGSMWEYNNYYAYRT